MEAMLVTKAQWDGVYTVNGTIYRTATSGLACGQ